MFCFVRGNESNNEEDEPGECKDWSAFDEGSEDQAKTFSPAIQKKEMDTSDNDEVPKESCGPNISCNEVGAGPGSDDPLSPADSNVESPISESSVINRIMEEDARCTLAEVTSDDVSINEINKDNKVEAHAEITLGDISTKDEANNADESHTHAEMTVDYEKVAKVTPLPNNSQFLQSEIMLQKCTQICLQNSVVLLNKISSQGKPFQKEVTGSPQEKKSREQKKKQPLRVHKQKSNKGVLLPTRWIKETPAPPPPPRKNSSNAKGTYPPVKQAMAPPALPPHRVSMSATKVEGMLVPVSQRMSSSTKPSLQFRSKKIHVPRPSLPQYLGVCFAYINRGFCKRSDCIYTHKVLLVLS